MPDIAVIQKLIAATAPSLALAFAACAATPSTLREARLELGNMLGANRIPLILLIAAQGPVLAKHYDAKDWDSPATWPMIVRAFGSKL
ncbi:MAG: hypothetical protein JNK59_08455 [Sterolibacteriaceae bacterium]|nr:hypothetical protein [Sterolibacteriaceae bacterium]